MLAFNILDTNACGRYISLLFYFPLKLSPSPPMKAEEHYINRYLPFDNQNFLSNSITIQLEVSFTGLVKVF